MNLSRIKALIIKEFIALWQDKKARIVLVVPPLILLFIFTFAATLDVKNITIGILNRDQGRESYELIQRIKGSPTFTKLFTFESENELTEAINTQQVLIALHIDEQFSRNLHSKKPAKVQLIVDGRRSNSGQISQGYIASIIDQYLKDQGQIPTIDVLNKSWFNPNLIYPWFTLTGLVGILTMLTTLSVTAQSIAREKELNTFDQLLITPLSPIEIMIGKSLPAICIGILEGSLLLFAGTLLIDLPIRGTLLHLYMGMVLFILSVVGVGMFISSISRTQQQAMIGLFLFMVPSVILSGYATRIANMPEWLQYIAAINPLKYFIIIVRGVTMKSIDLSTVIRNIVPMLLVGLFTLTGSTYFFRTGLQR